MIRYVFNYSNRTHLVANDFSEVKWRSGGALKTIKYMAEAMYLTASMNRLQSTFRFLKEKMNPTTITPDTVLML